MKILMLAPHPFYQDRGTPIAADLVLRTLSQRGDEVDVMVFPEGKDVHYPNVTIQRTPDLKPLRNIRPGFSLKKLICDGFLLIQALKQARKKPYDLVHAGEEAVFIALLIHKLFGIPYVYDMDSSLAQQLTDKYPQLGALGSFFRASERLAVKNAAAVLAVCQALADAIHNYGPRRVAVIPDISLLNASSGPAPQENLKQQFQIAGELMLYVGNLESYQGIDLLLASFAKVRPTAPQSHLVIIGGNASDIQKYQTQAQELGISGQVHLIGPRPIGQLKYYLDQADILVSPRVKGSNTPMKLYSYLDSGKALLATNLDTHTQVLNDSMACLAAPNAEDFAAGMQTLITQRELRARLGQAAQTYIAQSHTYEVFARKLTQLYDAIEQTLPTDYPPVIPTQLPPKLG